MCAVANQSADLDTDEPQLYQALSSLAVVCLAVGMISVLALLDWSLGLIPVVGLLLGFRALSRIRQNPDELTGAGLARIGMALSLVFLTSGWVRLGYIHATEVPEGYQRISFSDLYIDDSSKRLTTRQLSLDGKQVFIKGYIRAIGLPTRRDLKEFLLVRDNKECCFGATLPNLGDMVHITMGEETQIDYRTGVLRMAGSLRVTPDSVRQGQAVFHLDAEYHK